MFTIFSWRTNSHRKNWTFFKLVSWKNPTTKSKVQRSYKILNSIKNEMEGSNFLTITSSKLTFLIQWELEILQVLIRSHSFYWWYSGGLWTTRIPPVGNLFHLTTATLQRPWFEIFKVNYTQARSWKQKKDRVHSRALSYWLERAERAWPASFRFHLQLHCCFDTVEIFDAILSTRTIKK